MSVMPASVTPFAEDGRVDLPGLVRLTSHFRASGCSGIVVAGTNGEGPSLGAVEKRDMVRALAGVYEGFHVVLGIATPSLDEATWLVKQAAKDGASSALVMPPAYFREAPEEGLYRWFTAVADASDLSILLYNFPQRTGITLSAELVARLSQHERVVGLKDSSGEKSNLPNYRQAMPGKSLYVGDETLLLDALAQGWTGTISGAANVIPQWLVGIVEDPDEESRRTKFAYLAPGLQALRSGGQPALNKALLASMGLVSSPRMRLPLMEADPSQVASTLQTLKSYVR